MKKQNEIICVLDMGTTKTCALIVRGREKLHILGLGKNPSRGLKNGVVVNIKEVTEVVKKTIKEAENRAGKKIKRVWVSIAGEHVEGKEIRGFVKVRGEEKIISRREIKEVIKDASRLILPREREILHILPSEFIVDDQRGIKNPEGLSGARLEAKVYIVTVLSTFKRNIENSIREGGWEVEGVVLQSLASAEATLLPEEKELGVVLLDIGGGTTDISIFYGGGLRYTSSLGVGGNHITQDISRAMGITLSQAEEIKINFGTLFSSREKERIEVERMGGRGKTYFKKENLVHIIRLRMEEIMELILREINKSGWRGYLTSGAVITGGSSLLPGVKELSEKILGLPTRIGIPRSFFEKEEMENPIYATSLGLALYVKEEKRKERKKPLLEKIKDWLKEFF